jgi:hypothetical protein
MKYDVWMYPVATVKVQVEAESKEEAIKQADKLVDLYSVLHSEGKGVTISTEYAEEMTGYLVDVADVPEGEEGGTFYDEYGNEWPLTYFTSKVPDDFKN